MQKVIFLPFNSVVYGEKGKTLLDLAFENDILIEHNCGGLCACISCRVLVLKGSTLLNEKSEDEKNMLTDEGFTEENLRLSCQCKIINESDEEIIVEIPSQ